MKRYIIYQIVLVYVLAGSDIRAQEADQEIKVVQFSGVVVTEDEFGEMVPLPYTSIGVRGTSRGTYAEIDGFFSLAAKSGDTLVFSRIGFKTVEHIVPDSLESSFYSWYQVMSKDEVLLPEAVIYPWPSREHYKQEFLALDVSNEMRQRAEENLASGVLAQVQEEDALLDGQNSFELEKIRDYEKYKYSGQYKPQRIFDINAWSEFIKAWKRGDFKKKK